MKLYETWNCNREPLTVGGATLALAIIAMIVTRKQGLVYVNGVGHSFAQTMASENHFDPGVGLLIRKGKGIAV
jgi:hypothetical protein